MSAERKYQMTRIGPGDYLLPSNDATVVWRLQKYEERDGTLSTFDGKVIDGDFWRVLRWHRSFCHIFRHLDDDALDDHSQWEEWDSLLPTRAAAIASALRHG